MGKTNLTAGRIDSFKSDGERQAFLWDSQVNGLAIRAAPSGRKSYVLQARFNGKVIRLTIGDVTAWAIEEARDKDGNLVLPGARPEARRLQALIDQGIDPRQHKAEKLAEAEAKREASQRKEAAALDAWNAYVEARKARWSANHLGVNRVRRMLPTGVRLAVQGFDTHLLHQPANALSADQLSLVAEQIAQHPASGKRVMAYQNTRETLHK